MLKKSIRTFSLIATLFMGLRAQAYIVDQKGILRDGNGNAVYLGHFEAMISCPGDMRPPTAREWAELSQANGARGIVELHKLREVSDWDKFSVIRSTGNYHPADTFAFLKAGYRKPDSAIDSEAFWSSSLFSLDKQEAYFFNAENGMIGVADRDFDQLAVRCVPHRKG